MPHRVARSSVRVRLIVLVGVPLLGLFLFGALSYSTLETVKVNGPLYRQIVQNKDLIADILPPPEYIIEAYQVALELLEQTDRGKLTKLIERGGQLRRDFEDRREFWRKELPAGAMRTALVDTSYQPAIQFFELRDHSLIPALLAADRLAADQVMARMRVLYQRHRAAIDALVDRSWRRWLPATSRALAPKLARTRSPG
jgi:methyl-accepting chemotaxis protein